MKSTTVFLLSIIDKSYEMGLLLNHTFGNW